MRNIKKILSLAALLIVIACSPKTPPTPTPDIGVIYTSAANTVIAELTQTAAFFTPTFEPTATFTPAPPTSAPTVAIPLEVTSTPVDCDDSDFVADVNVEDGTIMLPGQDFVKTWRLKNVGSCTWTTNYTLVYGGYTVKMDGIPLPIGQTVSPGSEVEVSVQFKAPSTPGEYVSYWRMQNALGYPFGEFFYVKIIVE